MPTAAAAVCPHPPLLVPEMAARAAPYGVTYLVAVWEPGAEAAG